MYFKLKLFMLRVYWRFVLPQLISKKGVEFGPRVRFYGMPVLIMVDGSSITIGAECKLCSASEMTALGVGHPVILRTLTKNSLIKIGKNSGFSGASISAAKSVVVGDNCLIGANVIIADTDFHPIDCYINRVSNDDYGGDIGVLPVEIGNNVFIGANAIILKGVKVGDNSVIGAGSVVTKSMPSNSVYAGNPARLIRKIHEE